MDLKDLSRGPGVVNMDEIGGRFPFLSNKVNYKASLVTPLLIPFKQKVGITGTLTKKILSYYSCIFLLGPYLTLIQPSTNMIDRTP